MTNINDSNDDVDDETGQDRCADAAMEGDGKMTVASELAAAAAKEEEEAELSLRRDEALDGDDIRADAFSFEGARYDGAIDDAEDGDGVEKTASAENNDADGGDSVGVDAGKSGAPAAKHATKFDHDERGKVAGVDAGNEVEDGASDDKEPAVVVACADGAGDGSTTAWDSSGMDFDGTGETSAGSSVSATTTLFRNTKQDAFVKKGALARSLLTTALQAMSEVFASKESGDTSNDAKKRAENDDDESSQKTWDTKVDFAHVQEVAEDKSKECIALKRKLQESQSHIEVLRNESFKAEQSNSQLKAKVDRTLEALQIAGSNAANARAEADASNARAESLSGQLNDLQTVIEETRRGMEVVRRENDEISRSARSLEGRLIQVESELTRAARAKRDAVGERDFLKARAEEAEKLARTLTDRADEYRDEIRSLKKDLVEMEELERVRSDRTHRVEAEFQQARAGLLEATSAASEAESTVTSLRSVIEELRRENESLHDKIDANRDNLLKDRAKSNEALTVAEKDAQKWKIKLEEVEEEARKMKMDKASAEKQVNQLKTKVANLERRNDWDKRSSQLDLPISAAASTAVTPHTAASGNLGFINTIGTSSAIVTAEENKRKYVMELPKRESSALNSSSRQLNYSYHKEKENTANSNNAHDKSKRRKVARCSLCNKEGGMIVSCQCGDPGCEYRAHALCIGNFRSSASAGKREKTILCGHASK